MSSADRQLVVIEAPEFAGGAVDTAAAAGCVGVTPSEGVGDLSSGAYRNRWLVEVDGAATAGVLMLALLPIDEPNVRLVGV